MIISPVQSSPVQPSPAQPSPIKLPIKFILLDFDGVLIDPPKDGHERIDFLRIEDIKELAIGYRRVRTFEPIEEINKWIKDHWSSLNPTNELSMDLSYALTIMLEDTKLSKVTDAQIKSAQEIIKTADLLFKTRKQRKTELEYYEHSDEIINMVRRIKKQYPGIGIFPNTGASKYLATEKATAVGFMDIFTMDKLPQDPPIFGDTCLKRADAVKYIKNKAQDIPEEGSVVLFSDRLGDAMALEPFTSPNDEYHVFFGGDPFERQLDFLRQISYGYDNTNTYIPLKSARDRGHVLFLPPELSITQKVEKLEYFFSIREGHQPETLLRRNLALA